VVREGVDTQTLSTSVGHVPSTALPGHLGNFALAAHRDTLFRALKDIKQDDVIKFQSPTRTFTYQVDGTRIVKPTDVSVLRPDGQELLTLITCYPVLLRRISAETFHCTGAVGAGTIETELTLGLLHKYCELVIHEGRRGRLNTSYIPVALLILAWA